MRRPSNSLPLRHVTIAFAAVESSPVLDAIAKLVTDLNVEVSGVFIEDSDMLRAVSLPFALEFTHSNNEVRRADLPAIERELKSRAERAHRLIADSAARIGAKWTFRVVRQETSSALQQLFQKTDIVVYTPNTRFGRGIKPTTRVTNNRAVVVVLDSAGDCGRTMSLADRFAASGNRVVHTIIVGETQSANDQIAEGLQRESSHRMQRIESLIHPSTAEIIAAILATRPSAVVMSSGLVSQSAEKIREFDEAIDSPIILVN